MISLEKCCRVKRPHVCDKSVIKHKYKIKEDLNDRYMRHRQGDKERDQ